MQESFRPLPFESATGILGRLKFAARLLLDLQTATIHRSLGKAAGAIEGRVLDVGCGASPYKHLFNPHKTSYVGLDIADADKFDYQNSEIVAFNGTDIPFPADSFDGILCTEVLEHTAHYQVLVDEMHRVMKPGAVLLVTVPWSARFHYIPHDYFRYTPSALQAMFGGFKDVRIVNRGTDVSSIVAKLVVIWFRNLIPRGMARIPGFILALLATPAIPLLLALGHLSIVAGVGSPDDPLGYTVTAVK